MSVPLRNENEQERTLRIVAENLFMLCRRAAVNLDRGNADQAKEILSHASRIAAKIGIEERIIRTTAVDEINEATR